MFLSKPPRRSLAHRATAILTSVALLSAASPAKADFGITLLVVSALSTGLQMSRKKDLTPGLVALQTLTQVQELHSRFDGYDDAFRLMIRRLGDIPDLFQLSIEMGYESNLAKKVVASAATIEEQIHFLAKATDNHKPTHITQLTNQLSDLRTLRSEAFQNTAFSTPIIVLALVSEMRAMSQVPAYKGQTADILRTFDARLAHNAVSLAQTRDKIATDQRALELQIARKLDSTTPVPLAAGRHPIQAHSPSGRPLLAKRPRSYVPNPPEPPTPSPQLYNTRLSWELAHQPLNRAPDTYSITLRLIDPPLPQVPYRRSFEPWQFASRSANQASHDANLRRFFSPRLDDINNTLVRVFNTRAAAIAYTDELLALTAAARTLIANWNDDTSGEITERALKWAVAGDLAISRIAGVTRDIEDAQVIDRINKAAERAHKAIHNGNAQINAAIADAKRDKWRDDVIFGLEIFRAAYMTYTAINAEIDAYRVQASLPVSAKPPVSPSPTSTSTTTLQPAPPGAPQTQPAPIPNPPGQTMRRIHDIIATVKKRPAGSYAELPKGNLTGEEILLLEGLTLLHGMKDTPADKRFTEHPSPAERAGDVLLSFINEGKSPAFLEALRASLSVQPLADGTLDGQLSRLHAHRELTQHLDAFFRKRFPLGSIPVIPDNPCLARDCLAPTSPGVPPPR